MVSKEVILSWFKSTDLSYQRREISSFIADPAFPYEDRLEVWRKTPGDFQTIAGSVCDIDLPKFEEAHPEIEWTVVLADHRYEEVDMTEITEYSPFAELPEADKIALNEELMSTGYHCFVMDW
jgi:hypothetical protein